MSLNLKAMDFSLDERRRPRGESKCGKFFSVRAEQGVAVWRIPQHVCCVCPRCSLIFGLVDGLEMRGRDGPANQEVLAIGNSAEGSIRSTRDAGAIEIRRYVRELGTLEFDDGIMVSV